MRKQVTTDMLFAAIKSLVSNGILPKNEHDPLEIYEKNREAVKEAIEAALDAKDTN